jgi:hypothetical protein
MMSTSNDHRSLNRLGEYATDICWGAWSELGVSGWGRSHRNWVIDPEPLIVATTWISRRDPRLRDESMDWCIRNWRHISQTRLRNVLRSTPDYSSEAWGVYSATVNSRSGTRWPYATEERSLYRVTGRSTLRDLAEPSLLVLRMRAIFGVGARTEILRHFLLTSHERFTAAEIATAIGFAKRNVSEECELLAQAGLLRVATQGNRFNYSLDKKRHQLASFVGRAAPIAPDWRALFRVIRSVLTLAERSSEYPSEVLFVETHQALLGMEEDLRTLGLEAPPRLRSAEMLEGWFAWAEGILHSMAQGNWPSASSDLSTELLGQE